MAIGPRRAAPSPAPGTIRGLFVGIEDYVDDVMPDLEYCNDDAEALHAAFEQPDGHFGLLLERDATRANILGSLSSLMRDAQPGPTS